MRKKGVFLGNFAEKLVAGFLENEGYELLSSRFKKQGGEVDIIAKKEGKTIFIEVKYRAEIHDFEGIVDDAKLVRIYNTAKKFEVEGDWQFDVIFVDGKREIHHIKNVVCN